MEEDMRQCNKCNHWFHLNNDAYGECDNIDVNNKIDSRNEDIEMHETFGCIFFNKKTIDKQ